jgi:hypothetical protein
VPVWKVIQAISPDSAPAEVQFSNDDETITIAWADIDQNDSLRIFTVIGESSIGYALAEMSGEVQLYPLTQIEIQ